MKLTTKYLPKYVFGLLMASRAKKRLLESYGWYRNMHGGYTHPHAMDYMGLLEVCRYTPKQLEYKLKHGSRSVLPDELTKKKGKAA